jgi:hypothetical protein
MSLPPPRPGQVIAYAYLWAREQRQGIEEGRKDRHAPWSPPARSSRVAW